MKVLSKIRSGLSHTKINFMRVEKLALFASIICMVVSLALVAVKGLNFGIDFAGGILMEVKISQDFKVGDVRDLLSSKVHDVQIQNIGEDVLLIRVAKSDENQATIIKLIQNLLGEKFSQIEYRKIDYVGPQIGSELIKNGLFALLLSFAFIMVYIWVRFDWQFGFGGIFALLHDSILTLGFYSLTGLEFNSTSIAAILTIIGYSINDSVVIYDRIRENIHHYKKASLSEIINSSINSTLSRTVLTAGVTLFSLLALMIFGGNALFSFSTATFFGILVGTYSSIYISAPILIYFDPRKKKAAE